MKTITACEGDFIETQDNLIFDVKGCIHPPDRIIAYLRYYPNENGDRIKNDIKYKKIYSLNERQIILSQIHPNYIYFDPYFGTKLQSVPLEDIKKIHNPIHYKNSLIDKREKSNLQKKALDLTNILIDQIGIDKNKIGISGSLMVSFETSKSDIDLIIYGSDNVNKTKKSLPNLFKKVKNLNRYTLDELKEVYKFKRKDTKISWDDFKKIEKRKVFQGKFKKVDFFIRGIKEFDEIKFRYGDFSIEKLNNSTIRGIIRDNSNSIFTPCIYKIETTEIIDLKQNQFNINELFSYRGRFCEILKNNEKFEAHGTIEKVKLKSDKIYYRLIIGNHKEDYLKLV
ncbi:MAG: hypothetical protein ACTSPY_14390 [Candidatus Helarchaeota archaeon]